MGLRRRFATGGNERCGFFHELHVGGKTSFAGSKWFQFTSKFGQLHCVIKLARMGAI
jgi:hypothetical protein